MLPDFAFLACASSDFAEASKSFAAAFRSASIAAASDSGLALFQATTGFPSNCSPKQPTVSFTPQTPASMPS